MREDITTDPTYREKMIREYYEQLYTTKFNSSYKMDKLLERSTIKLIQQETDNLNCPISIKEIDYIVKNLPTKKTNSRPRWLD